MVGSALVQSHPACEEEQCSFHSGSATSSRSCLLLHAYDKGELPSKRHETKQIEAAKKRLIVWLEDQQRAEKAQEMAEADARAQAGLGPGRAPRKR